MLRTIVNQMLLIVFIYCIYSESEHVVAQQHEREQASTSAAHTMFEIAYVIMRHVKTKKQETIRIKEQDVDGWHLWTCCVIKPLQAVEATSYILVSFSSFPGRIKTPVMHWPPQTGPLLRSFPRFAPGSWQSPWQRWSERPSCLWSFPSRCSWIHQLSPGPTRV